jgi:hypothetical protein
VLVVEVDVLVVEVVVVSDGVEVEDSLSLLSFTDLAASAPISRMVVDVVVVSDGVEVVDVENVDVEFVDVEDVEVVVVDVEFVDVEDVEVVVVDVEVVDVVVVSSGSTFIQQRTCRGLTVPFTVLSVLNQRPPISFP